MIGKNENFGGKEEGALMSPERMEILHNLLNRLTPEETERLNNKYGVDAISKIIEEAAAGSAKNRLSRTVDRLQKGESDKTGMVKHIENIIGLFEDALEKKSGQKAEN